MRTLLLLILLHAGFVLYAQDRCATVDYTQAEKMLNGVEAANIANAEAFLQQKTAAQYRTNSPVLIKIPVVVHVLYKEASQNISDAQIKSQIDVLNKDFRRRNADTANTPERFQSIAADAQIEFYLATADPNGRATTGIVRKQTSISAFIANDRVKKSSQGGDDAWDSKNYLNIWVGNLVAGAGYSTAPGSDAALDGVVIRASVFGTLNMSGAYNLGRTATHEIGHWLGLKHIWGDAACGDDGVYDTPTQGWYTQDCPSGFRSSCSNGEQGDMYMNFMDYTSDACMNLFTEGQKQKMLACFAEGGPRTGITKSKGLAEPWLEESPIVDAGKVNVFPNPANNEITVQLTADWIGKTISIVNTNGSLVQSIQVSASAQKINLSLLKPGLYFIRGEGLIAKFIKL